MVIQYTFSTWKHEDRNDPRRGGGGEEGVKEEGRKLETEKG